MSESDYAPPSSLTREAILGALTELSDELGAIGVSGEICLFGGTVMVLAFGARPATKDVDAGEPSDVVDIRFLIEHLQLRTSASVLAIVADYYPARLIPVRTQYLIEGLFDEDPK